MARSEVDIRVQLAELRTMITEDKTPEQIMEAMSLDLRTYNFLRKKLRQLMLDEMDERVAGENWAEYALAQEVVLKKIDKVFDQLLKDSPSTIPTLLRTKADIIDRIMDRAITAGLIKIVPNKAEWDGIDLNETPESELEQMINNELRAFKMMKEGTTGSVIDFEAIRKAIGRDRAIARKKASRGSDG